MTTYFSTIPLIANEENTKPGLRAVTSKMLFYLIGVSRHQV